MPALDFDEFQSLPAALLASAQRNAERRIALLDNRGRFASQRSFPEVIASFGRAAANLESQGLGPGERAVICLPTSWEWLESWFGALFLGALPVSIAPPGALGSPRAQIAKALRIAERVDARMLVASAAFLRDAESVRHELQEGGELGTENLSDLGGGLRQVDPECLHSKRQIRSPHLPKSREDIAFLQLTSGSTGLPRAVEISHRAALHNVAAMRQGVEAPHDGRATRQMVSWLPLYHDMGLVGCLMNSMLNGFDLDLLTPRSFLARPWIWLEALSRYADGTILSTAPNFAYQLCVERTPRSRLAKLDLRGWRDAMTGSEMVKAETAAAFCEHFSAAGFSPAQLRPCYGMAETTLAITFDSELAGARLRDLPTAQAASAPGEPTAVVSCGIPIADTEVRVLAACGTPLAADRIGRIEVKTPSLFSGYFRDPEATRETLVDGWLRTGDLGFTSPSGELYLSGREKDLLILHGQNLMPHELEWVAEEVLRSGGSQRSAAFSVPGAASEEPVLLVETNESESDVLAQQAHEIASAIGRTLGVPLREFLWVKRGSIPRTSSGKIQRRAARELYLRQQLETRG